MNVRTIFGVLAWMMSSTLDASDVSSLVAISSDGNPTTYLLSDVQRIEVNANDTEGTMSVIGKNGYEEGEYKKILFASTTTSASGEEVPRIYIYPNPVTNFITIEGVDEDDTSLVVYDMKGNCVMGEYGNVIEVAGLAPGMYILSINEYFVKFIKK